MTAKKKIIDKNGVQVFPITHTKAVLDDNGNSVEERLQEQMDVINQKQLEVGAVPSDIAPTKGSTYWVTSGGVYDVLSPITGGSIELTKADCTLFGSIKRDGSVVEEVSSNWLLSPWVELPETTTTITYSGSVNIESAKGLALYADDDTDTFIATFTGSGTIDMSEYPTARYMRFMSHVSREDSDIHINVEFAGKIDEIDKVSADVEFLKGEFHSFYPSEDMLSGEVNYYWDTVNGRLTKKSNNSNWYWYAPIDVTKLLGTTAKLSLDRLTYTFIVYKDGTYVSASTLSPVINGKWIEFAIPQNASELCVSWAYNWTTSGNRAQVLFYHEGTGNYDTLVEEVERLKAIGESVSESVSVDNSDCLLLMGSSLTAGRTMPAGYNWADKLNDISDIPIVNGGHGGNNMLQNIAEVANDNYLHLDSSIKFSDFRKTFIMWGNSANGTSDGINGYKALSMAEYITRKNGANIVIGSEEPFGGSHGLYAESQWAKAHNIPYMIAQKILAKTAMHSGTGYYAGWIWSGHRGWRGMGAYVNAYMDLIRELPVTKSVKVFKVRDKFLSAMSSVSDLAYDNYTERLYKWYAIGAGSGVNTSIPSSSSFNGADNLDNVEYNITGSSVEVIEGSQTGRLLANKGVSFNNYALVEMILSVDTLSSFSFECGCDQEPDALYVMKCPLSGYTASLSEFNSVCESIPFFYADETIRCELESFDGVLLYDKVRIVIACNGNFLLTNPKASYTGQRKKVGEYVNYRHRKSGTELRTNTGIVASDWTLSGASIISFPSGVKCYTRYNDVEAVLKLGSNTDTAVTTVTHQKGKRVAIRIVAQNFFKWMTTRYSGPEYSDYVADLPQLSAYEYDYGKLYLSVNDNYGQIFLVPSGWAELYTEVDCEDAGNLTIKLQRANESGIYSSEDTPIFIHDISVQEV